MEISDRSSYQIRSWNVGKGDTRQTEESSTQWGGDKGDRKMRKVLVALPEEVISLIDRELLGKLGEGYSDTLRTIIMSWLSEKGYLTKGERIAED